MKKKRIMVIGPRGSGKTTLVNSINGYKGELKKTQDTIYGKYTIDVPGAYLENTWMYKHMIALSQDTRCVLILIDRSNPEDIYSHGFAKALLCPSVGVMTKCDLTTENEKECIHKLKLAGVSEPYFKVSAITGEGMDKLKDHLDITGKRQED